jgi:hypothetical protein
VAVLIVEAGSVDVGTGREGIPLGELVPLLSE